MGRSGPDGRLVAEGTLVAARAYIMATRADPHHGGAWNNLGMLVNGLQARRPKDRAWGSEVIVEVRGEEVALNAATCIQKAVELNPRTHVKAINNMGMIYHQQNDLDAAEAMYRRAVEAAPTYATGWYNLGLVAMSQRKEGLNATECFLNAIKVRPPPPTYYNCRPPPTVHRPRHTTYRLTIHNPSPRLTDSRRTQTAGPRHRRMRTSSWRACSSKSRSSSSPPRRPHVNRPSER